jgi:hypothetical protein
MVSRFADKFIGLKPRRSAQVAAAAPEAKTNTRNTKNTSGVFEKRPVTPQAEVD